jgi:HD-GYP domain-containing protein (c-di-GMP phosphodiesterase class II)
VAWGDIPEWALDTARVIMETVRVKDPETYSHCARVGRGARLLAQAAGLNEYEQKVAEFSGLFHDIGKIGISDSILLKPAKLTDEEYKIMQSHPELSAQIIQPMAHVKFFADLLPGILHHHERIDGKGYPQKIGGDEIPLAARIILIADTFDAITATRAYRKGLPAEVAQKELRDFAGRQFDAQLVQIFLDAQPFWAKREQEYTLEQEQTVLKRAA